MTQPLRIGLLLTSFRVPTWIWTAIREIQESDYGRVVVVGHVQGPTPRSSAAPRGVRRLLRRIDELADEAIPRDQDAFTRRNARKLLARVPVLKLGRAAAAEGDSFAAADVAAVDAMDLDVLVWFGRRHLRGDILHAARAGVWSFRHSDDRRKRGGPTGFWEVHEGWPVAGASLQVLAELPDQNQTLARTSCATVSTSVKRTSNALVWTALPMLERNLERLCIEGEAAFLERARQMNAPLTFYSNRPFPSPTPQDLVVHAVRRVARTTGMIARRLLARRQWALYVGMADDLVLACWRLRPLAPPIDRFWADPHILKVGDRYFMFIEELLYASGKGHISVMEIDERGRWSSPRLVLEEPHHLSYPFVFEHDGAFFMVPESAARNSIDLYRATSFPDEWVFVEHLMTGVKAYDATLLREHGRWWLFASVTKYPGAGSGDLNLYSSDRLMGGDWRLHPASPLSSDVSGSRPAGAILRREGRLYRPGQDGSGIYGRAIRLNEIVELSDSAYREELVTSIEPHWNDRITRTHTLAHAGRLTVLDALWLRSRWTFEGSAMPDEGHAPPAA